PAGKTPPGHPGIFVPAWTAARGRYTSFLLPQRPGLAGPGAGYASQPPCPRGRHDGVKPAGPADAGTPLDRPSRVRSRAAGAGLTGHTLLRRGRPTPSPASAAGEGVPPNSADPARALHAPRP